MKIQWRCYVKKSHHKRSAFSKYLLQLLLLTKKALEHKFYINFYLFRTSNTRWGYVCWNLAQLLGCMVYANFVLGRYTSALFKDFGHPDHQMTLVQLLNACFYLMLPGILCLVLGFFMLLHAWQNAFAEILRFADRLFYKVKNPNQ